MAQNYKGKYLVLSDLHFGTTETSLNNKKIVEALVKYMSENSPWNEVIFSGDLLDLNLSTFTRSIEGNKQKNVFGFRDFLKKAYEDNGAGLEVSKWVYVPGNHDYKIWDMLATRIACEDVLASGEKMNSVVKTPLMSHRWDDGEAFISGVFPKAVSDRVCVDYPDRFVDTPNAKVVVTHGHYLDWKQTLFKKLDEQIKKTGNEETAVRNLFIETAQYQTVANAVSYRKWSRILVSVLLGKGVIRKLFKPLFYLPVTFPISALRDEPINEGQLRAIEFYLKYFRREYKEHPDYFIFGHTHSQGKASTADIRENRLLKEKDIKVFNAGSFIPKGKKEGTFIRFDISDSGLSEVALMGIKKDGQIIKDEQ